MLKNRVAVYIDGFNYYYAIIDYLRRNSFSGSLKWLNYKELIEKRILQKVSYDKDSLYINFYTAINTYRQNDSQVRHLKYIKALEASGINVIKGKYKLREVFLSCHLNCYKCKQITYLHDYKISKDDKVVCSKCGEILDLSRYTKTQHPEEKQTDVNIARDILVDALTDKADLFYIFSTDSDFVPIVEYIMTKLNKQIQDENQSLIEQNNGNLDNIKLRRLKEIVIVAPATSQDGGYRYEIENFIKFGAGEYRLKLGQLVNYQFPSTYHGLQKPANW